MKPSRRKFIRNVGMASLAATATPLAFSKFIDRKKLSILVLGGTNFVGPHFVNQALRRGHDITLFNRGKTNPNMFPHLEHIKGNRFPNLDNGVKALMGTRRWDAVIDTWQGPPGCVALAAKLLQDRTDHYIYISSIATFKNYRAHGMTEESPLLDMSTNINSFDDEHGYSERKRAAEQAVLAHFPQNGSILRCGSIRGESYSLIKEGADFYNHHLRLGNSLVLPDDTEAKFQLIDVKDLANFGLNSIERHTPGSYNMVGPLLPLNFKEYILQIHQATENISTIYWADYNWLRQRNVSPWSDLPNYIPMSDSEPGFYTISNKKAIRTGLTFRPVFTTIVESLGNVSLDQLRRQKSLNGLSDDRRLALIEDWKSQK